jgi:hypothetical protein
MKALFGAVFGLGVFLCIIGLIVLHGWLEEIQPGLGVFVLLLLTCIGGGAFIGAVN